MNKPIFLLFFTYVLLFNLSCEDDDTTVTVINKYEGCCNTEAGTYDIPGIKLFIPNAFTPNNDGLNDIFTLNTSDPAILIVSTKITGIQDELLFEEDQNFVLGASTMQIWAGSSPEGNIYEGLFNYEITVQDTNGQPHVLSGSSCAILCPGGNALPLDSWTNCTYPAQHDGEGGHDENLPTQEEDNCM